MATNRRDFLKASASMAAGLAASRSMARAETEQTPATPAGPTVRKGDMLYRTLGRTGEQVSLIGLGGFHLGQPGEEEAIRIVRTAVDRGVTFMDNCWDYNGGATSLSGACRPITSICCSTTR